LLVPAKKESNGRARETVTFLSLAFISLQK